MKMKYRRGFLQKIRKNILHKKGGVDFAQYPSFFYEPLFHSADIKKVVRNIQRTVSEKIIQYTFDIKDIVE